MLPAGGSFWPGERVSVIQPQVCNSDTALEAAGRHHHGRPVQQHAGGDGRRHRGLERRPDRGMPAVSPCALCWLLAIPRPMHAPSSLHCAASSASVLVVSCAERLDFNAEGGRRLLRAAHRDPGPGPGRLRRHPPARARRRADVQAQPQNGAVTFAEPSLSLFPTVYRLTAWTYKLNLETKRAPMPDRICYRCQPASPHGMSG